MTEDLYTLGLSLLGPMSKRPAPGQEARLFFDKDTGSGYVSNGSSWIPTGGGLPAGITGDGLTPGGLVVAGALTAGDPNAASVPSIHQFFGFVSVTDTPGNNVDDDPTFQVRQQAPLIDNFTPPAFAIERSGTLNGFNYHEPAFRVVDNTATTAPALQVQKSGTTQFQVDGDGIQVHGKFKSGSVVTRAAGAGNGKSLPVYDEAGTIAGYVTLTA